MVIGCNTDYCVLLGVAPSGGVVSLAQCSVLNSKFWESLHKLLLGVAPTCVPLPHSRGLLRRLRSSCKLQNLFSLTGFEGAVEEVEWVCCALSNDDNVSILCIPRGFFHHRPRPAPTGPSSPVVSPVSSSSFSPCSSPPSTLKVGESTRPVTPRPLWLPLLLLQLDHTHFLEVPTFAPSSRPPDSWAKQDCCLDVDLKGPVVFPGEGMSGKGLVPEIGRLHRTCFLNLLHTALGLQLPLSPEDFYLGLQNCQQSCVTMDTTALFSAVCPHSVTSLLDRPDMEALSVPLPTEALCHMLAAALAKREWTTCVGVREGEDVQEEPGCGQSSSELNQVLLSQLERLGFQAVAGCQHGYYWLDTHCLHYLKQVRH